MTLETIKYEKGQSIEAFMNAARIELVNEGRVRVVVEPGDATKYDILFTLFERTVLVSLVNLEQQTCLVSRNQYEITPDTPNWKHPINPHTAAMVAELYNNIYCGFPRNQFVDWEKGRAILTHGG